uniref:HeH/LEM domain-containing protein n=1 Tax=Psychrobacter sp. (strain PRwf-1) TaxID=349106 RepID=A5WF08_PSYWF
MTEPKQVPGNLADLVINPEYAEVDETYTVKELQAELKGLGVAYRSSDSKDALVWRFLDAQQGDLEPVEAEEEVQVEAETEAEEFEQITVYNDGAYNLYEPHSRTLFYARKEAVIELKPRVTKERVLRNIEQINATRGKVLVIR